MDKYSSKQFFQDIKSADRSRHFKVKNKKKKAYSKGELKDLSDELLLVAENESEFYRKKDAAGAVEYARKDWLKLKRDDIYDLSKEAAKIALKELIKAWKEEGHI